MTFLHTVVAVLAAVSGIIAFRRRGRRRLLASVRAKWGQPAARHHKMNAIAAANRSRFSTFHHVTSVDDRTWADLDLDDVFAAIDRTESTLGQQALYHRLHTAPTVQDLSTFEALVRRMSIDSAARERAQIALARLQDAHGYDLWWLARPNAVEHHGWHAAFPVLAVATLTMACLTLFWHVSASWFVGLLIVDFAVRWYAADQVGALGGAVRQIAPVVATGEELAFLTGSDIDPIVATIPSDVVRLRRLKTIARWLSGDPFLTSYSSSQLQTLITSLAWAVYEYVNIVLLLDAVGVYFCTSDLQAHAHSLVRLSAAIGDVDAAISVASWRKERNDWTRPHFADPGSRGVLSNMRHPLVSDAVPNSIVLEPGRGILVTGSNMSGKTTFLKAVGVNAILAQAINTCLATSYEAPMLRVQSCIGRADDLIAGKSYYIVEVEQVLARVRASTEAAQHLFLFDELFRGTNAVERIAAAESVLRELVERAGHRTSHSVLAATHDAELVELLDDFYSACHFTDTIGPDGLVFEYRLAPGPATTRNAITLLDLHGAPDSLVQRALTRAAALDQQRRRAKALS
jgi:MutS-like protein